MTINILISTIDLGINKIGDILLPIRPDVKYIVSHQYQDEKYLQIPKELKRKDIIVSQIPGKGLTKSRNHAIRIATGDICIIADDDVKYTDVYFDTIINTYQDNNIGVACFKINKEGGREHYKPYPEKPIIVNTIQEYSPSSIEITFRLKEIKEKNVLFDERFGLGTWLNGGGENLFIYDCIQKEIKIGFFPQYIVKHPHDSTIVGLDKYHKRRVRLIGAMDMRLHGKIAFLKLFPRLFKYLPDLIKYRKNPFLFIYHTLEGILYIHKNNSIR